MLEHAVSLTGRFTQATRLLRLTTPVGGDALLAECVRGEEAIGTGFTFSISALSTDAAMSLRSLLGQPALLELLTTDGSAPRPFHGYLTAIDMDGANGGLARYTLTLQAWSAFMAQGRDSRVFQDKTVFDILDAVFGAYQGLGKLLPAWRFDIAQRDIYPLRSLTTQYQESDLAFAERLMAEEGLFYFFEHTGDAASPSLGSHTMVVADHNGAFRPNAQASVRFTQPGAVMKEDSMDRWRSQVRLQTNAVQLRSWDYRTLDLRPVHASGTATGHPELGSNDIPGAYAFAHREHGQRIADRHAEALDAQRELFTGAGTVRTLSAGSRFSLSGQAVHDVAENDDERSFIITRVVHLMHNNLSADLRTDVVRQLGTGALASAIDGEHGAALHAVGKAQGERPLYRNRIDAIRTRTPYRSSRIDGDGRLLHPRPVIHGQQSAIVVGPPGAVMHTDRDHRIKVQFHWHRGQQGHNRLVHPVPDGHVGAPADDGAGTWVRVATPLAPIAGANWGSHALPRVGQEVLIDFLEGNIDRPVVIGALYNGKGGADAQNNEVAHGAGAASGGAGAWFPGEAGAHAHPAVLSGLKSQAMASSQGGAGGYSQLVFDDTPGQSRLALQRHAQAHRGSAELNLGQLRHQTDNQRLAPAGFGAELKSEHAAALRAGRGMLVSADGRKNGIGGQLDSREAVSQMTLSHALQESLAGTAQKHNAMLKDEPTPAQLPAIEQMANSIDVAQSTSAGRDAGDGGAKAAAYTQPQLQVSAPAGIAAVTPASAVVFAGASSSISAGSDINCTAQASAFHAVQAGISLFTYGKATKAGKPNQETGIRLHAASGRVSMQSQLDDTQVRADKAISVASVTGSINVAARKHVLMAAQGAFIRMEGGNIALHAPGKVELKASKKELTGPVSKTTSLPQLPKAQTAPDLSRPVFSQRFDFSHLAANHVLGLRTGGLPYRVFDGAGALIGSGQTSDDGLTQTIFTEAQEDLTVLVGDDNWQVEEYFIDDDEDDAPDEQAEDA